MESKKTRKADLERRRPAIFALALVISVALFVIVIEHDFDMSEADIDYEMLEEVVQDMELQPLPQNDMVAAMPEESPTEALTDELNIVDGDVEMPDYNDLDISDIDPNAGIGDNASADIEEPIMPLTGDEPISFRVVECLPEFPGGMSAFVKWLTKNLKYPASAQKRKVQGKVIVSFIVNKDGSISDCKIVRNVDKQLDHEALRVIRMMPKWKPGENNGEPCRTMFVVPVVFSL